MGEVSRADYGGREVLKNFPGHGTFKGSVVKYFGAWKSHPWRVRYEDGDSEDLNDDELLQIIQPAKTGSDSKGVWQEQAQAVKNNRPTIGSQMGPQVSKHMEGRRTPFQVTQAPMPASSSQPDRRSENEA
ncbi:hypothetical protein WJX84_000610 [Apatococcus fuscideae]|uniref:PTM/DIR17-like Tudor domain-containing protein n=1 Tax=Apatococcus fuscideae TaxID=2026836 RepID=A0AAW1T3J3_9CHLO